MHGGLDWVVHWTEQFGGYRSLECLDLTGCRPLQCLLYKRLKKLVVNMAATCTPIPVECCQLHSEAMVDSIMSFI